MVAILGAGWRMKEIAQMRTQALKAFFTQPLYQYDKAKVNWLKAILPIMIIIHHISNLGYSGIELIGAQGDVVMYLFFAMSGYGLVISYIKNEQYINGFLRRSLTKLFVPYLVALILFVVYRYFEGIDQIALFKEEGLFSFVPTSWYIWILSYFYIFYFLVFRYVKSNNLIKVILTCALVLGYVIIAPFIGIEYWRYFRCPAFCVGMFFALYDNVIRTKFVRWHALIALALLFTFFNQSHGHRLDVFMYPTALFIFMYAIRGLKEIHVVKFLSAISLEMFIIQMIPIYIATNDFNLTSTTIVVPLVLLLDIVMAYIIHLGIQRVKNRI